MKILDEKESSGSASNDQAATATDGGDQPKLKGFARPRAASAN